MVCLDIWETVSQMINSNLSAREQDCIVIFTFREQIDLGPCGMLKNVWKVSEEID